MFTEQWALENFFLAIEQFHTVHLLCFVLYGSIRFSWVFTSLFQLPFNFITFPQLCEPCSWMNSQPNDVVWYTIYEMYTNNTFCTWANKFFLKWHYFNIWLELGISFNFSLLHYKGEIAVQNAFHNKWFNWIMASRYNEKMNCELSNFFQILR